MKKKENEAGFTLVELLVTITVLGIILALALPAVTRLQESNKETKYQTYEDSMISSAKLYIDSYAKDIFGNNISGCYDIPYQEMEDALLLKDFNENGVTCNDSKTFVRVYKINDEYRYEDSIYCKKNGKEVYSNSTLRFAVCENEVDVIGPEILISPDGTSNWNKSVSITITVQDAYGLFENISYEYGWTTDPNVKPTSYQRKTYDNKRGKETELTLEVSTPKNATGKYYLVIVPINVRDVFGNYTSDTVISKEFLLDNVAPVCTSSEGGYIFSGGTQTITGTCTDELSGCKEDTVTKEVTKAGVFSPGTVCDKSGNCVECPSVEVKEDKEPPSCGTITGDGTNWLTATTASRTISVECDDGDGVGCEQPVFSERFTATAKTGIIQIKDKAGNTRDCEVNVYIDKTSPKCDSSGGSNTWVKKDVIITGKCTDEGSGCESSEVSITKKYYQNQITNDSFSPGVVRDIAGNVTSCPKQTVKIDGTVPTCTYTGASTTWARSRTVTVNCSDTGSGCQQASKTLVYTTSSGANGEKYPYAVKYGSVVITDNVGNQTTCTPSVYVENYPPQVDKIYNVEVLSGDIQVTWNCSSSTYCVINKTAGSGGLKWNYSTAEVVNGTIVVKGMQDIGSGLMYVYPYKKYFPSSANPIAGCDGSKITYAAWRSGTCNYGGYNQIKVEDKVGLQSSTLTVVVNSQ